MKKISINELSVLTDKDRRTIKKYLYGSLAPDPDGRFNSARALQLLFIGDGGPTFSEAQRLLAVRREKVEHEKEQKLHMENALTRRQQISASDIYFGQEGTFIAIRQRILSSHLTDEEKRDLMEQLQGLRASDLYALGKKAAWEEFKSGKNDS